MDLAALLRAFADLAPRGRRATLDVTRDGPFLWRGAAASTLGRSGPDPYGTTSPGTAPLAAPVPADPAMRRLAALDALHHDERLLREGFAWLCGPVELDGQEERVLLPLVSAPVRVASTPPRPLGPLGRFAIAPAGDREVLALVTDPDVAAGLEDRTELGRGSLSADVSEALLAEFPALQGWIRDVLAAAGLPRLRVLPPSYDPRTVRRGQEPAVVVGSALFVARDVLALDLANVLRSWAGTDGLERTALAAVYGADGPGSAAVAEASDPHALAVAAVFPRAGIHLDPHRQRPGRGGPAPGDGLAGHLATDTAPQRPGRGGPAPGDGSSGPLGEAVPTVRSPLPLSRAQQQVLARAQREPLVVVSGPPGSGKSHTVAAVAVDTVARGGSVLIATQSIHAADVIGDLMARQPGPDPILFGDAERRSDLATALAGGVEVGPPPGSLTQRGRAVGDALSRVTWLEAAIADALDQERRAGDAARWEPLLPALVDLAPGAFDTDADLAALVGLLHRVRVEADSAPQGWFARWGARRAEGRLRKGLRTASATPLDDLHRVLEAARARRAAATLASRGGTALASLFDELERAEAELRLALGAGASDRARAAPNASAATRRAVAGLATALRAGRGARREALRRLDGEALVKALPLWVGTLRDVEDLLPTTPGLFDLVVVDEASQVDQLRLAPALLRATRAVIAGDPRQLRHVSFVADVDIADTLAAHGLGAWADRLDVRRISGFDAAAAQASVTFLDEHHRSVPHLIEFSARRFYPETVQLVTRHPSTEAADAIEVVAVGGSRDGEGVNRVEVDEVEAQVRAHAAAGWRSIGVVSPFRAQADALEAMLLDRFELEEITAAGLRVGTVHAFQGSERDVMIVSMGLAPDVPAGSRRFVEDPNLFNVMVTRARRRMVVVTSLLADGAEPPDGLVGDFLRHAATPPEPFPLLAQTDAAPADAAPAPATNVPVPGPPSAPSAPQPAAARSWADQVAAELASMGVPVRVGYPVGPWEVDLVMGEGTAAVAVEAGVHPAGVAAHLERHRTLRAAGWRIVDAHPTRFDGSAARAAIALSQDLTAR
jgi:hypothetical protein